MMGNEAQKEIIMIKAGENLRLGDIENVNNDLHSGKWDAEYNKHLVSNAFNSADYHIETDGDIIRAYERGYIDDADAYTIDKNTNRAYVFEYLTQRTDSVGNDLPSTWVCYFIDYDESNEGTHICESEDLKDLLNSWEFKNF